MKVDDFDAVECNEAFAAIALMWQKEFDYPMERFNPRGGAIALGHPLGASGVALMTRLLRHLEATGGRYGFQTMCEGGGQANATVIEASEPTVVLRRQARAHDGAEGGELLGVVRGGVVDEAHVDAGRADGGERCELLLHAVGFGERVERVFVLQDDVDRLACARSTRGVARARSSTRFDLGACAGRTVPSRRRAPPRGAANGRCGRRPTSERRPVARAGRRRSRRTRSTGPSTRAPVATSAARSARIASSARAPRSSNGARSRSNSSRSDPTPTPRIRRPSVTTSSVP